MATLPGDYTGVAYCDDQLEAFWPTVASGDIVRPPSIGVAGANLIYKVGRSVKPVGFNYRIEPWPGQTLTFAHEYPRTTAASGNDEHGVGGAFTGHRVTGCTMTNNSLYVDTTLTNAVTAADYDRCITGHGLVGTTSGLPYGTVVDSIVNANRFMVRAFESNSRIGNVAPELGSVDWKTATVSSASQEVLTFPAGTFSGEDWDNNPQAPSGGPWRVEVQSGPQAGQRQLIIDSSSNTLTLESAFSPQLANGTVITIQDASAHWTKIPAANTGNKSGQVSTTTRLAVNWQGSDWPTDTYANQVLKIVGGKNNNQDRNIIANGPDWIEVRRPWSSPCDSTTRFEIFQNVDVDAAPNATLLIFPTWKQDDEGASAENFQFGPGAEHITLKDVLCIGFIPPGAEGEYKGQTEEHNSAYRFINGCKDIELDGCNAWNIGGDFVNIHGCLRSNNSGGIWVHDCYNSTSPRRKANRQWFSITGNGAEDVLIERNGWSGAVGAASSAGGWSGRSGFDIEPDVPSSVATVRRLWVRDNYWDRHGLLWMPNGNGKSIDIFEDWLIEDNTDNSPGTDPQGAVGHPLEFSFSAGQNDSYSRTWQRLIIRNNLRGPQAKAGGNRANQSGLASWEDVIIEGNDLEDAPTFRCLNRWRIQNDNVGGFYTRSIEQDSATLIAGNTSTVLKSSAAFGGSTAGVANWKVGHTVRMADGPAGGEEAQIVATAGSQITVSPPFSGAPQSGNTVRVYSCSPAARVDPGTYPGTFTLNLPLIAQQACAHYDGTFTSFVLGAPAIDRTVVSNPPVAPGNFKANLAGTGTLVLSWTAVSNATGYHLERQTGATWTLVYDGTQTTAQNTGLSDGVMYTFRLWAYNADGTSPTVTTTGTPQGPANTPPTNPTLLVATAGPDGTGTIDLNWQPSTDPDGDAVGYAVYRSTDGVTWPGAPTAWLDSTTTWTDSGLAFNDDQFYRVRAFDALGDLSAGFSNTASATPLDVTTPPPPPPSTAPGLFTVGSPTSFVGNALMVVGGQGGVVVPPPPPPPGEDKVLTDTVTVTVTETIDPHVISMPTPLWQRSDAEILEPAEFIGVRADRWEYELVSWSGAHRLDLHPVEGSGPAISMDTNRTIMRTLDGIILTPEEAAPIVPLSDRLIVRMVLENGSVYQMGRFLFGDHNRPVATYGNFFVPNMFDESFILDQPIERSVGVDPAHSDEKQQKLETLFRQLAAEVGITQVDMDGGGMIPSEPIVWPAGTSRLKVLADMAEMMGCLKPYLNAEGVLRCRRAPSLENPAVDHNYGANRMFADQISITDDSYRAPNRYIRIGSSKDTAVVGVFDVPAVAPHSIAQRHFVVADVQDLQGIDSNGAAFDAARAAYVQDLRTFEAASFTAPVDPRHDVFDVIRWYDNQLYLEVSWQAQLCAGGDHEHKIVRLWQVTE